MSYILVGPVLGVQSAYLNYAWMYFSSRNHISNTDGSGVKSKYTQNHSDDSDWGMKTWVVYKCGLMEIIFFIYCLFLLTSDVFFSFWTSHIMIVIHALNYLQGNFSFLINTPDVGIIILRVLHGVLFILMSQAFSCTYIVSESLPQVIHTIIGRVFCCLRISIHNLKCFEMAVDRT